MKIALIGPGIMPIPPSNWGAVEILIWNYQRYLEQAGHQVTVFNTKDLQSVADAVNQTDFDFIHLHYDEHIPFFNTHINKSYCMTSHYGWLLQYNKWEHEYYDRIFDASLQTHGIIALSPNIANVYRNRGYGGFLCSLRNGVECSDFRIAEKPSKNAICIGKIETRKRQAKLAQLLDGKVDIDFVGPLIDNSFQTSNTNHYLGAWDKATLYRDLTEYAVLVLASDGEAAPLVVLEAMAAGVSIVVSKAASENLTPSTFVKVISEETLNNPDELAEVIKETAAANPICRQEVLFYARNVFDFKVVISEYEQIIQQFRSRT